MKKKVVTLTESQLVSLIKNTVKRVLKEENEDMFNTDSDEHKYNIEDFDGWEFDASDDILYLFFDKEREKMEQYKLDWDANMIGGYSPPTREHPGDEPELEITIDYIFKIHPNEKRVSKDEFYSYLKELGIYKEFWGYLEEVSEEKLRDKYDDLY